MIQQRKKYLKHVMVRISSISILMCLVLFQGKVDMVVAGAGTGELIEK
jgi:hypothetical protein